MATLRWVLSAIAIVAPTVRGQTCYVSAGVEADSSVVPCGSSGVSACCQLGDICLSDSACFNYVTGVTYLYGCTDSSYSDGVCPWKCGTDYSEYNQNLTSSITDHSQPQHLMSESHTVRTRATSGPARSHRIATPMSSRNRIRTVQVIRRWHLLEEQYSIQS